MVTNPQLPTGLKKQVQLNTRDFQVLMRDKRNDVTRLTQNSASLDDWINKLGGYTTQNVFSTGNYAAEVQPIIENITSAVMYSPLPKGGSMELVKGVISENTNLYSTVGIRFLFFFTNIF